MAKTALLSLGNWGQMSGTTLNVHIGGQGAVNTQTWSYNSARTQLKVAATLSGLAARIGPGSSNRTLTARKNNNDTSLTISPATEVTAEDTTHSVSYAADDYLHLYATKDFSGNPTWRWMRAILEADSGTVAIYGSSSGTGISGVRGGAVYLPIAGNLATYSSADEASVPIGAGGSLQYVSMVVNGNALSGDATATLYVNGSATSATFTIPSSTTGLFTDAVHSVDIADGDLVCLYVLPGSGGVNGLTISQVTAHFVSDDSRFDIFGSQRTYTGRSDASVDFYPLGASIDASSYSEGTYRIPLGFDFVSEKLRLLVLSNTCTDTVTMQLRRGANNANQVVTIGSGVVGLIKDSIHTDEYSATQGVGVRLSGGDSGELVFVWALTVGEPVTEIVEEVGTAGIAVTTSAVNLLETFRLPVGTAQLGAEGQTMALRAATRLPIGVADIEVEGRAVTGVESGRLPVGTAALAMVGEPFAFHDIVHLAITAAQLGIEGQAVDLGSVVGLRLGTVDLRLSGQPVRLLSTVRLPISAADIEVEGQPIGLTETFRLAISAAGLTVAGQEVGFLREDHLFIAPAEMLLAAHPIGLLGTARLSVMTIDGYAIGVASIMASAGWRRVADLWTHDGTGWRRAVA